VFAPLRIARPNAGKGKGGGGGFCWRLRDGIGSHKSIAFVNWGGLPPLHFCSIATIKKRLSLQYMALSQEYSVGFDPES